MITGWLFLGAGAIGALIDFVFGWRMASKTPDDLRRNPDGSLASVEPYRRVGRIFMIIAPVFFLVFAAIAFGLVPVEAVEPIGSPK